MLKKSKMPLTADLLERRKKAFVLWRPLITDTPPTLFIGPAMQDMSAFCEISLEEDAKYPDLWSVDTSKCDLVDDTVYFYWFKVRNTNVYAEKQEIVLVTDPLAMSIDRSNGAPAVPGTGSIASHAPAGIVYYKKGELLPCDIDPDALPKVKPKFPDWSDDLAAKTLPANNTLVIYELPTRWVSKQKGKRDGQAHGSFQDVLALLDADAVAPNHPDIPAFSKRAHLIELGVNSLELLPPFDSVNEDGWGYGSTNFFAADYDMGKPGRQQVSTASFDLSNLIKCCHQSKIRFFCDIALGWSKDTPYSVINYPDFLVQSGKGEGKDSGRDGWGGDLLKYDEFMEGYDPVSGKHAKFSPSRQLMILCIIHWMQAFRLDGIRLDSILTIGNYDFVSELRDTARQSWDARGAGADKFLVVGEELSMPYAMLTQNRLDSLWNERFKQIIRNLLLGRAWNDDPDFASCVRKLIDCRLLGDKDGKFGDLSQAVNYLTSHDVGGPNYVNGRIYDYLTENGVIETEQRIKLGFACLLTAVGIPMILAGEEFADQHDLPVDDDKKQKDPVNWVRMEDKWRQNIYKSVSRLVHLRTSSPALRVNDVEFIHEDMSEGKRVFAWKRGVGDDAVIVVANFSDWSSGDDISEYAISGWPENGKWHEVIEDRNAPNAGHESIKAWDAKVYQRQSS